MEASGVAQVTLAPMTLYYPKQFVDAHEPRISWYTLYVAHHRLGA
jgi:hypothetical protein